ncbi:hypothetical protein BINDI_1339 [Bifidobacterium [indicum] DSM 20214 = LMG 11587]|uniref:Uncharacterized protein n=2 Tax=Bifidobacterium coryneforme TaxID=1687 RepID=A0A087VW86_9BIFI|nr:hypothetical protein BINDI_1339 [Bifidobacterium indicum LMG 11587 = DSM 20214]
MPVSCRTRVVAPIPACSWRVRFPHVGRYEKGPVRYGNDGAFQRGRGVAVMSPAAEGRGGYYDAEGIPTDASSPVYMANPTTGVSGRYWGTAHVLVVALTKS